MSMFIQHYGNTAKVRVSAYAMIFLAGLLLSGCGDGNEASQPEILLVTPRAASVPLGQTVQFRAIGYMDNGQTEDLTSSVSWQSSNADIATVNQNGLATSVSIGTMNMTAHWRGLSSTASLVVSKAVLESLTVTPPSASIILGQTAQLNAIGMFSDKTAQDMTSAVAWSSDRPGVATVNSGGLATSMAVGNTTVTASVGKISASNQIIVSPAMLTTILVESAAPVAPLGAKEQFTAHGIYTDGTRVDITNLVSWTSAPMGIVTLNPAGLATARSVGNATITATLTGVTGSARLTVSPAALVSIAVQGSNPVVPVGTTVHFTAMGTYTDGSTADITNTATWVAQPPEIVNVGANGLAVTRAIGNAIVTATSAGISGSSKLSVSSPTLLSIAVHGPGTAIPLGTKAQFRAVGTYTDGSTADLTNTAIWASSPAGILDVNASGMAITKALGNATVIAASHTKTGSGNITVSPPALVFIQISSDRPSIPLGSTQQLRATGVYTDSSTQNLTASVQWTSSSPEIAGISTTGLVTAKAQGAAGILASSGGVTGAIRLSVSAAELNSISISPIAPTVPLGGSLQLAALGSYTDGSSQNVTSQITWTIDKPDVASISTRGMVSGLQVGSAVVSASLNGLQASATLTIQPLVLVGYFDASGSTDTTLRITNPAITGQDLCVMVYVFDQNQQMSECCGCLLSQNGLRTLSLSKDLLSNPLTGSQSKSGTVMLVPADYASNPSCNANSITPAGAEVAWSTHLQTTKAITEDTLSLSPLSATLSSSIQAQCLFIQTLGSGQGICTCGTGN